MKTRTHPSFLVALFFLILASCSQNKSTNKALEVNSRKNQTTTTDNNNALIVANTSTEIPTSTTTGKEKISDEKGGTKKEYPKNWPWRGICFQSEYSDTSDIAYLASIGVNFVRIQLKPLVRSRRKNLDPLQCFYDEINWAETILNECKKHGMTSIIAYNYLVLDPKVKVSEKTQEFWDDQKYIDSTYSMISIIANHFKNRGDELSAYEVMGEPVIQQKGGAKVPPQLELFFKNILKTIRKVDQKRWLLITPGPWGRPTNYMDFAGFNIKDDRLIYGAHMYLPDSFTHQGIKERGKGVTYPGKIKGENWDRKLIEEKFSYLKNFEKKHNCLVYIGEFQTTRWSNGADEWVKDVIQTMDKNQWSWTLFAFEAGTDAWNPYFDVVNKSIPGKDWQIKSVGPTTPLWKYMISEYAKNKK
ncbi:MAG: glycoside hydrolase family 5 protein [Bacteroidia bacterium]